MDELALAEYKALRATIRERGTVRAITFLVTFCVWAALELVAIAHPRHAIATVLPLMVLVAGFETVFQLHLGVERVGRYLQVAFEHSPGWETVAMAYGKAHPTSGSDPLFTRIFLLAVLIGILQPAAVLVGVSGGLVASSPWMLALGGGLVLAHVAFGARVLAAKRRAARQRPEDLERFRDLVGTKP